MPVFGTCAGMILLASDVLDARPDQRWFGAIDVSVRRNGYGRQVDSFETDLAVNGLDRSFHGVFIRAPKVVESAGPRSRCSPNTTARRSSPARERSVASFHPELTPDARLHERFVHDLSAPATPGTRPEPDTENH